MKTDEFLPSKAERGRRRLTDPRRIIEKFGGEGCSEAHLVGTDGVIRSASLNAF